MGEVSERFKHPSVNVPDLDALDAPVKQLSPNHKHISYLLENKIIFLTLLTNSLMCEMKTDGLLVKGHWS